MYMSRDIILMTSEQSFHNNYGAVLQGYALYQFLNKLGFSVDIVKYREGEFTLKTKNKLTKTIVNLGRLILRRPQKQLPRSINAYEKQQIQREKLFIEFQNETMTFFNDERMNYHQLCNNTPDAKYYICGSDQIWNPFFKSGRNDLGYFLKFVPKGKRKIAYAPSFGCDDLPEKAKKNIKALLSDFYSISVREKTGVEIIKRYANRDAQLVLDPTMLLEGEYWKSISNMPSDIQKPYILCYRFADSEKTKFMIDKVSETLGIPVISLPLSNASMNDDYKFLFDVGPREFIGLIENASLVCTDSFHATVFSILMKTPVCVFLRESFQSGDSMNTRIFSLLETLSLQSLLFSEGMTEGDIRKYLQFDYSNAHKILKGLREKSKNYLIDALKEK